MTPLTLWVELTESCQYKCRFCYNYWRAVPPANHVNMSEETAADIVSFLQRCDSSLLTHVALAGGDPTAHPNFVDLALRFAAHAGQLTVVTHGANLSVRDLDTLSQSPNIAIQFSIPSLDRDRYRFLTGMSKLDRVLTALMMCRELAIPVSLSALVTAQNQDDLPELVHLAAEAGAEYLVANRFLAAGRGILYDEKLAIKADAFDQTLADGVKIGRARNVRVLASGHDPNLRQQKGAEPKLTVSTNGEIRICSLVSDTIATLKSSPMEIIERSESFWKSAEALDGCFCASTH
jgi:MoaA/NifB/PqqE/SkfB family radical SAM enzyme